MLPNCSLKILLRYASLYNKEEQQLYHTIQNRIKGKDSIENKLLKKELEPSVKNAKDYLRDIVDFGADT